jgi:hypothetical protein
MTDNGLFSRLGARVLDAEGWVLGKTQAGAFAAATRWYKGKDKKRCRVPKLSLKENKE